MDKQKIPISPAYLYLLGSASATGALLVWQLYHQSLFALMMVLLMTVPSMVYGRILTGRKQQLSLEADTDRFLLQFARKNRGRVSVSHLVAECNVTIDEAEYHLARLVARGYAQDNMDPETGVITYVFPEFQSGDLAQLPTTPMQTLPIGAKNRWVAGIFAITLGMFGVHKFYLGKSWQGVIYILFCWSGIPTIIGLIEGVLYLTQSDEEFNWKYNTRLVSENQPLYLPKSHM